MATALAADGVFVSNGDFYATTVVERLGLAAQGLVRAGCACYTTADEVDRLDGGRGAAATSRAGLIGILTRVFSHSSTSVAPLPAPSLRMVKVSTGLLDALALHLATTHLLRLHLRRVAVLTAPLLGRPVHDDLPLGGLGTE